MLKIDNEKRIRITRGDSGTIVFTAQNNDGSDHEFQAGDIVRLKVMEKKDVTDVVLIKDITVGENCYSVDMGLNSNETRIGEYINAPVTYWYEVELNPDTNSTTIIGYDEDGAKEFILYPEGKNESRG
jgi:hypothetical protein